MRFSERYGFKPVRQALQKESMDDGLRNRLWNMVDLTFCSFIREGANRVARANPLGASGLVTDLPQEHRHLLLLIWHSHFKRSWDEVKSATAQGALKRVEHHFLSYNWWEVYDLLEFLAQCLPSDERDTLIGSCNNVLKEEMAAYRFVGTTIAPITSEEEIKAIESALQVGEPLVGVTRHIQTALSMLSDRKEPNHRKSIDESILAVESVARLIAKKPKATLDDALKEIQKRGEVELHPALQKAFGMLYGYTSDEKGIRHAMGLEEAKPGQAEALYMLVTCSAFVSFLIAKAADAGILLTTQTPAQQESTKQEERA